MRGCPLRGPAHQGPWCWACASLPGGDHVLFFLSTLSSGCGTAPGVSSHRHPRWRLGVWRQAQRLAPRPPGVLRTRAVLLLAPARPATQQHRQDRGTRRASSPRGGLTGGGRRASSHARSARCEGRPACRGHVGPCRGGETRLGRQTPAGCRAGRLRLLAHGVPAALALRKRRGLPQVRDQHRARQPGWRGHLLPQRRPRVPPAAAPPGPWPDPGHGFAEPRRPSRRPGHGPLEAPPAQRPQPIATTLQAGAVGRRQAQADLPASHPDAPAPQAPRWPAPASSGGVHGSEHESRHVSAPQVTAPPGGVCLAHRSREGTDRAGRQAAHTQRPAPRLAPLARGPPAGPTPASDPAAPAPARAAPCPAGPLRPSCAAHPPSHAARRLGPRGVRSGSDLTPPPGPGRMALGAPAPGPVAPRGSPPRRHACPRYRLAGGRPVRVP
jgi:hypothetical protein